MSGPVFVIPAKAGIACREGTLRNTETPASAGVTSISA